jgi:hypothetical protein
MRRLQKVPKFNLGVFFMKRILGFVFVCFFFVHNNHAFADLSPAELHKLPACMDEDGSPMAPNNDKVVAWKKSTPNHFLNRGFVTGKIVGVKDNGTHFHIEIAMDGEEDDYAGHIEIVYNYDFGSIPNIPVGGTLVACGDYITSTQGGRYPPSPVGAIVHWVHMSPDPYRHASGFLAINGVLYGSQNPENGNAED